MKYITLGNQSVPAIGLGTYKLTGPTAIDIISEAIQIGYRHLDTAQLYDNEKEVGIAVRDSGIARKDFFITTKVWPSNLGAERFLPSVEESLSKLKMDYVDLLLIHWPHQEFHVEDYINILMQAQQKGFAKTIGVSNFNIAQLKQAKKTGAEIVTNQIEFHPWINQTKLYNWMLENQIALTAYCPLGQGKWMTYKKLEALAAQYARTPAQIILCWMMQKESILAIPKSSNIHRLKDNISIFDFELTAEEMEMIDAWRLENIRITGVQAGAKWD